MKTKEINEVKNKKKKRGIGKKIILVILFIILLAGSILGYKVYKNGGGAKGLLMTAMGHDKDTILTLDKIYCLILGKSQNLTDTLILASYDPKDQSAALLSIPRDTFIGDYKSSATSWDKINAVYQTENGPQKLMKYVTDITGINVKYYLMVDTEALKVLVDEIGGVTFNVPIDMDYDDSSQDLYIHLKAGEQLLDGDKAEQVVRFRHNNDGSTYPSEYGQEDIGRMKTQREFLKTLAKKLLSWNSVTKINNLLDIAEQYVETNLDFKAVKDYIPYAVEFNINNLKTAVLPGVPEFANVVWIYSSDKEETKKVVNKLFFNINEEESEVSDEEKEEIKIELLNGIGNEERFDEVSDTLKRMGYNIKSTGSTSKTSKTTIINRNNAPENITEDIKNVLKIGNILQGDSSNNIDITIIVGEDILKKLED